MGIMLSQNSHGSITSDSSVFDMIALVVLDKDLEANLDESLLGGDAYLDDSDDAYLEDSDDAYLDDSLE